MNSARSSRHMPSDDDQIVHDLQSADDRSRLLQNYTEPGRVEECFHSFCRFLAAGERWDTRILVRRWRAWMYCTRTPRKLRIDKNAMTSRKNAVTVRRSATE